MEARDAMRLAPLTARDAIVVVCDRCGRDPQRYRGTWYCWRCSHECTFTRTQVAPSSGARARRTGGRS